MYLASFKPIRKTMNFSVFRLLFGYAGSKYFLSQNVFILDFPVLKRFYIISGLK